MTHHIFTNNLKRFACITPIITSGQEKNSLQTMWFLGQQRGYTFMKFGSKKECGMDLKHITQHQKIKNGKTSPLQKRF